MPQLACAGKLARLAGWIEQQGERGWQIKTKLHI